MKRLLIFALLINLISSSGMSQSCLPDGIVFSTQSQIDSFQINYPGCTVVEGDVKINGNDISDLSKLNVLTSIEGNFTIGNIINFPINQNLTSLSGLNKLTNVGGNLSILGNEKITNLNELFMLVYVGGI